MISGMGICSAPERECNSVTLHDLDDVLHVQEGQAGQEHHALSPAGKPCADVHQTRAPCTPAGPSGNSPHGNLSKCKRQEKVTGVQCPWLRFELPGMARPPEWHAPPQAAMRMPRSRAAPSTARAPDRCWPSPPAAYDAELPCWFTWLPGGAVQWLQLGLSTAAGCCPPLFQ